MAQHFAREGATLVLLARSGEQLARAAESLRSCARGAVVQTIECDVRNQPAVAAAIDRVIRVHGRVDVLVNNAGVVQVTPFVHAQVHDFEDSLNTHFWGPLFLIRACLPHFRRQGSGHIVNVSSVGGRVAVPHLTPYCVGKFALAGFSDALHAELAPLDISVTTVTPFLMRTGGHRNATVRGQHRKEALWFALGSASGLTAFSAEGAARTIVEAVRHRRARVAPGWPSRASEVAQAMVPELTAALGAAVVRWILPGPSRAFDANISRTSRDLDLGGAARLLATNAARRWNQHLAADERQRKAR
jgi:short-subunit dehydrogenase